MAGYSFASDPVLVADFKTLSIPERLRIREEARAVVAGASTSISSLGLSESVDIDHARTVLASIMQAEAELAAVADGGTADAVGGPLGHAVNFSGQYIYGR
jgi:hypothetical protein